MAPLTVCTLKTTNKIFQQTTDTDTQTGKMRRHSRTRGNRRGLWVWSLDDEATKAVLQALVLGRRVNRHHKPSGHAQHARACGILHR